MHSIPLNYKQCVSYEILKGVFGQGRNVFHLSLWWFIGIIKIRDLPSGKCVKEFGSINVVDQGELSEEATPPGYTQLLYHNQLDSITAVTVDHNILIYGLPNLETKKQVRKLFQ